MAWRWVVACTTCWCLWVNHYSRDLTGALEREIEADLDIDASDFQALNTVYFAPNIVMPAILGYCVAQKWGAECMLVILMSFFLLGTILIAVGSQQGQYGPFLLGRALTGITYESIDMSPLSILVAFFPNEMGMVTGLFNSFLRCGSVANFILSPPLYRIGGLAAATWMSAAFAGTGVLASVLIIPLCKKATAVQQKQQHAGETPAHPASSNEDVERRHRRQEAKFEAGWTEFTLYLLIGASIYSSIVPFWFYGAGFIRSKWGYSLEAADTMVLLVEGGMAITSPFIGKIMDSLETMKHKVFVLMVSSVFVPLSFVAMALGPASVPPIFTMTSLSLSVACTIPALWCLITDLMVTTHLDVCNGLMASALNLGGTLLPPVMAKLDGAHAVLLLAFFAALTSCLAGLLLLRLLHRSAQHHHLREKLLPTE